ncbi:hypothetical protein PoB_006458600 [Plakobranchus ocellatus]|uniref:Uncharacterized protein n=1 Tax=Plakobranchus ocellatus TaxID=259542 RepID=A0AAV4D1M0_9GAST|nr:hypothetical protein PoB_006458600 [Plakobranchus ocellatus]
MDELKSDEKLRDKLAIAVQNKYDTLNNISEVKEGRSEIYLVFDFAKPTPTCEVHVESTSLRPSKKEETAPESIMASFNVIKQDEPGVCVSFLYIASPQQGDLRLSGPQSGQGAGSGARSRDRRVPADLRADSQATVLPTPPRTWRVT